MQDLALFRGSVDANGPVLWIDDPHHARTALEIFAHLFQDLGEDVVWRKDFHAQIGKALRVAFRLLIQTDLLGAPEAHVGTANGIRVLFGEDSRFHYAPTSVRGTSML